MKTLQDSIDRIQVGEVIGEVIGDFAIGECIGSGGVSRVHRARQLSLDRDVAVKLTERDTPVESSWNSGLSESNPETTGEGRLMAALHHENIVDVYSETVSGSIRLLAMQLVEGPSLAELIPALHDSSTKRTALTEDDCRNTVRRLAEQKRSQLQTGFIHAGETTSAESMLVGGNPSREHGSITSIDDTRAGDLNRGEPKPGEPKRGEPRGEPKRGERRGKPRGEPASGFAGRSAHRSDLISFGCSVTRQIALALQHVHEHGIFHSDVKPANILFTSDAKPLLTDFNVSATGSTPGCADRREAGRTSKTRPDAMQSSLSATHDSRTAQNEPDVTESRPVGGTLLYMAPEQLATVCGFGNSTEIDGRADIYSLGLVLFELLTGNWPFPEAGDSGDPLLAPRQLYASRLSTSVAFPETGVRIPRPVRSIIEKCLQADPQTRYATAGELALDLRRFLDRQPLQFAEPPSLRYRAASWISRRSAALLITSLLTALVLTTSVFTEIAVFDVRKGSVSGKSFGQESGRVELTGADQGAASHQSLLHSRPEVASDRHRAALQFEQRGREALAAGDFDRAVENLQRAVALSPRFAAAQHNLGIALFRSRRFAEACDAFDSAIRLGARSARVYSCRAAARFALGDSSGARADFDMARQRARADERDEIERNYRVFLTHARASE